ncbi:MAG: hydantoinase B/oxoprolinase family protein [Pseudomonadota bacterium]|uniref:hydantoinase B/oxoprolinase family protein n=1 Tax=Rhizorhabdus wittichii TaxID=160791 RepID=UPI00031AF481|nr:hydantoinase B/oxoprolinase family protein [Rhizorhabdus wittichii]
MQAEVTERRGSDGETASRVDPITMNVVQGALDNIATEMGYKLMRMAYSSIIRESEDFGASICDVKGRQLCECAKSTPLQSGPIPGYVRGILRRLEERGETINEGDVILHNDPYYGASHSPDLGICIPIFHEGELIAFSVTTAHHLDIGSAQPGSMGMVRCEDRYAEGLYFCAIKIVEGGRRNDMVWHLIRHNIRVDQLVMGDLEAQIVACEAGARRYLELVDRYGIATLQDAVEDLFDYSERLLRRQIEKIPDGTYEASGLIDGFVDSEDPAEKDLEVKVTIRVAGSDMHVDFDGTAPQLRGSSINMPFEGTVDVAVWLAVRTLLLDTDVHGNLPQNEGLYRPITISAPLGTIVNPIAPAATISRAISGNRVADTVIKALSTALPENTCAGTGSVKGVALAGLQEGAQWVHLEVLEGSYGGRFGKDGMDCVDTLYANTRNNPIEDVETHAPLRVRRYEFRDVAPAAGRWRGGTNSVREVEYLTDGSISVEGDNHRVTAWGFAGGRNGATAELTLKKADGHRVELPSMCPLHKVQKGDVVIASGGTGGGYGDPLKRDPERVRADFLDGLIDRDIALAQYGVVLDATGSIDLELTQQQRVSLSA